MSKFSGKCDLYDWFSNDIENDIKKLNERINRSTFYIGDKKIAVIDNKNLALYYPYTVAMGYRNNATDSDVIKLSEISYIDRREQEHLLYTIDIIKCYISELKKKKLEITRDNIVGLMPKREINKEMVEIIDIILAADNYKVSVFDLLENGIRYKHSERLRSKWAECLLELGFQKDFVLFWVYKKNEILLRFNKDGSNN